MLSQAEGVKPALLTFRDHRSKKKTLSLFQNCQMCGFTPTSIIVALQAEPLPLLNQEIQIPL
jgi:hypothetical protein